MAFITGITADPPQSTTRGTLVSESIHFVAYRIDDGPMVEEPLTAVRRYERGQEPRNESGLAPAQRTLRNTHPVAETVIRVEASLSDGQWSWSYFLGKVQHDRALNQQLELLLHASPAVHKSDEIVVRSGSDGLSETVLVPDRKRVEPFDIPGIGTIWPVYASRHVRNWDNLARVDRGHIHVSFTGRYNSESYAIGLLGGEAMCFEFWAEPPEELRPLLGRTAQAFLDSGPGLRDEIASQMLSYYERTKAQFREEDWDDYGIPRELDASTVWSEVRFSTISIVAGSSLGPTYVVVEGSCSWEPEHGLMLSFRDGDTLAKVSPYDGHFE